MQRIVIVEDDPAILRGLSDNLRQEGYDVLPAEDGDAGYRLIRDAQPDLVLLDLMLPGPSGYELCRRVRSAGLTTPVVMLSARGDESDRVLGLDTGADDYVAKPFSLGELLARIRAILRQRRDLRAEHAIVDRDLRQAADVQRQLLPRVRPQVDSLAYGGCCIPARQVGGDYFDYVELEPGVLGLLVADVAGKGISAALLVAALHGVFRAHARGAGDDLSRLAATLNTQMCAAAELGRFATVLYVILDPIRQRLVYVNAGHPPGILRRADGRTVRLSKASAPLGLFGDSEYSATELRLEPGDWLVLFTDGVTEAADEDDVEFGDERVVQAIGVHQTSEPDAMCDAIVAAVRAHTVGRAAGDDLTIVAAHVR
ncbi:MAG TPA: SpoIIE family protein phosphatase [Vicinamibacterales bacterium]